MEIFIKIYGEKRGKTEKTNKIWGRAAKKKISIAWWVEATHSPPHPTSRIFSLIQQLVLFRSHTHFSRSLFLLLSEFSFSFLMFYYHLSRFTLWWIFLLSVFPTPLLLRHLFIGKRPFPPTTLLWRNYSVINKILYKNNFNALQTFFEI